MEKKDVYLDIKSLTSKDILSKPRIDIFTYSFPCQNISNAASIHNYQTGFSKESKSKSSLVWEIERLLKDVKKADRSKLPKSLLMENVSAIVSKKFLPSFKIWLKALKKIGYTSHVITINSKDHGHPQNRRRVFCISYLSKKSHERWESEFEVLEKVEQVEDFAFFYKYKNTSDVKIESLSKYLCTKDKHHKESEIAQPNLTKSRWDMYYQCKKLHTIKFLHEKYLYLNDSKDEKREQKVIREIKSKSFNKKYGSSQAYSNTITTRQDRYPNAGVIDFETDKNFFRFITPREALLLMGFKHKDYSALSKTGISSNDIYTFAGNSIVVPTLKIIMKILVKGLE